MVLIIDNYDSFVYNLFQYFGICGAKPKVFRNNKIDIEKIKRLKPSKIVLSPGPGHPAIKKDFGVCKDILSNIKNIPILGVCLGHQGIIHHFGGSIVKNKIPMHGKTSKIKHSEQGLFKGIKNPLIVMRYHSLIGVDIPHCISITAKSLDDNVVMAVEHLTLPIFGVQFHPESIMTEDGKKLIENFVRL